MTVGAILHDSWQVYRRNFRAILAIVLVVWIPLELLGSYVDAFVFGEDDFRKSWKLAQFLDHFFGIIATAGVIFIGHEALAGHKANFRSALATGLKSWGRMWWTRFLSGFVLLLGILLLVVPGLYWFVRLSLVEQVVVCEHISGPQAIKRSFELTEGHFWTLVRLGLALLAIFIVPIALTLLTSLVPALDHWLIDASSNLFSDVAVAFGTIAFVTTYSHLVTEETSPPPLPA
jgi:hypothetical protein